MIGIVLHLPCGVSNESRARIVGGDDTVKGSHPWFAGLLKVLVNDYSEAFCGGTLINDRYVLTAGHCIYNKDPKNISVALDFYNIRDFEETEMVHEIEKIIVHKDYDDHPKNPKADIGLLKLKKPVNITQKKLPICLPTADQTKFRRLTAVGWGRTSKSGSKPDHLQQVTIPQDDDNCELIYGKDFLKNHICVRDKYSKKWKDVCKGDSGGPLVAKVGYKSYLAGIVSYSTCLGTPASVFTRVSYYLKWIEENTSDGVYCKA
ncbi:trypsin-1-like protein [Leptotrombidium deliense]|uniref:Trypsin-1-like protein n=1 Tax=Leptotrombidium deliense TaxID=299467 RepID=A0A443SMV8_9ACAR|nr:trypsin-1-like protein [Leptotrombidium deliense]